MLPAYGRALLEARRRGVQPWLVVLALGWLRDPQPLAGERGVARVGYVEPAAFRAGDLSLLLGLDVLVSLFEPFAALELEALARIDAAAQPATLWRLEAGPPPFARRIHVERVRGAREVTSGRAFPLTSGFREVVQNARTVALLAGDGVFARPEFQRAREHALRKSGSA